MQKAMWTGLILFLIIGLLAATAAAHAATYTFKKLDDPKADETSGKGTGTWPCAINAGGQVVGNYYDASGNSHGFLYSGGKFARLIDHLIIQETDHPEIPRGPTQEWLFLRLPRSTATCSTSLSIITSASRSPSAG